MTIRTPHGEYTIQIKRAIPHQISPVMEEMAEFNEQDRRIGRLSYVHNFQKNTNAAASLCIDARLAQIFEYLDINPDIPEKAVMGNIDYIVDMAFPMGRQGAGVLAKTDKDILVAIDHYSSQQPLVMPQIDVDTDGGCGARVAKAKWLSGDEHYDDFSKLLSIVQADSVANAHNIGTTSQAASIIAVRNVPEIIESRYDEATGVWTPLNYEQAHAPLVALLQEANDRHQQNYTPVGPRGHDLAVEQNIGQVAYTLTGMSQTQIASGARASQNGWLMEIKPHTYRVSSLAHRPDGVTLDSLQYPAANILGGNFDTEQVSLAVPYEHNSDVGIYRLVSRMVQREPIARMLMQVPSAAMTLHEGHIKEIYDIHVQRA